MLLTGIVALNVAVLQLNLQLDRLGQERARLRTENDELRQQAALNAVPDTIRETRRGRRATTRSTRLRPATSTSSPTTR